MSRADAIAESGVRSLKRNLTVAVIGHVNHGKTALTRALTGIETDRLQEEIERGLSITLGFAWRDYGEGSIDFIDAPGHEDFIRAMVAGASGAQAALLVVSAVERFGRQTWEHLQIAGLLGIEAGIVAVTKADLLPAGAEAAVLSEIRARLAATALADAPIIFCSAASGRGVEQLHARLGELCRTCPGLRALPGAFLPIDRAFTLPGAGTIVTGTLLGGPLTAGAEAVLQPSERRVDLRALQVHGQTVVSAQPGGRVAVGLRGVSLSEVKAGDVLCASAGFPTGRQVDVQLALSANCPRPLKHLDEMRLMWGARRDVASVRLIGARTIAPGGSALAQLRFSAPVVAFAGQRGVLRRLSPAETVGGVLVLDPTAEPVRGKTASRVEALEAVIDGDLDRIADAVAARSAGLASMTVVARLARRSETEVRTALASRFQDLDADRIVRSEAVAHAREAYIAELTLAHGQAPARAAISVGAIRAALARVAPRDLIAHVEHALATAGDIRLDGNLVALAGHDPLRALSSDALERLRSIETALRDGGVQPPDLVQLAGADGADADLVRLLVESGRATELRNVSLRQTLVYHGDALATAFTTLNAAFPNGSMFATGEARAALATTRKFIVPLLERFDALGLTIREGDLRRVAQADPSLVLGSGPGTGDVGDPPR